MVFAAPEMTLFSLIQFKGFVHSIKSDRRQKIEQKHFFDFLDDEQILPRIIDAWLREDRTMRKVHVPGTCEVGRQTQRDCSAAHHQDILAGCSHTLVGLPGSLLFPLHRKCLTSYGTSRERLCRSPDNIIYIEES